MNQLCDNKCECKCFEETENHRSTLIKMELPDYDESHYSSKHSIAYRAIRYIGYISILMTLCYVLWRIQVIESTLMGNDRLAIALRRVTAEKDNQIHRRVSRSTKSEVNNYFENHPEEYHEYYESLMSRIHGKDQQNWTPLDIWMMTTILMSNPEMSEVIMESFGESRMKKTYTIASDINDGSGESQEENKLRNVRDVSKNSEEEKQKENGGDDKSSEESGEKNKQ